MKNFENSYQNILVTVDVQNDFVSGSLAVGEAEQVIDPINQLAAAVRANLGQVALTRDWHPKETPHFETWPVHCVAKTQGAEFEANLDIRPEDVILSKGMGQTDGYSGAEAVTTEGTRLEDLVNEKLARAKRVRVFIGGLATDYCVKATAIDLAKKFEQQTEVDIYAVVDAMRAVNLTPSADQEAIDEMAASGVKLTDLAEALNMINQNQA